MVKSAVADEAAAEAGEGLEMLGSACVAADASAVVYQPGLLIGDPIDRDQGTVEDHVGWPADSFDRRVQIVSYRGE